ncbi:MAG: GGDEF domain-containing protein, partial [Cyanobacteria bacterium REEB65]|nr:GGDEF domain-containing protein [Cyanobacteria bacterium REEB65]
DVDRFKSLNDLYGHAGGDRVLKQLSQNLAAAVRSVDLVARLGGDEFVMALPSMGAWACRARLAELSNSFTRISFDDGKRGPFCASFSAGIAEFPRSGSSLDDLLAAADEALYLAKGDGRHQIVLAP